MEFNKEKPVWYFNYCTKIAEEQKKTIKRKMKMYRAISLFLLIIPICFLLLFIHTVNSVGIPKEDTHAIGHGMGLIIGLVLSSVPYVKVSDLSNKYFRLFHFLDWDQEFKHYYYSKQNRVQNSK